MDRFVSHHLLRLDAKGRVSVPAPFRAALARDGFDGLYCHPVFDRPALDAGGNALLAEIEALITGFPPYSEEREQFSLSLYGTSERLKSTAKAAWCSATRTKRMPGSQTPSSSSVSVTNFESGSLAVFARN
jgi:MraZ protein